MPGSDPTSDFAGFVSSSCALARAAAMVPMFSLERCMPALHRHNVEADRTGLRPLRPNPMPERLLRVLRHQHLEFGLGFVVLHGRGPRPAVHRRELRPGVRPAHINRPYRLDSGPRWVDPEETRGLADLDAPPEPLLG